MSSWRPKSTRHCRRLPLAVHVLLASACAAAPLGAQGTRATSCTLEVVRTDTLRLADGREAFVAADVADTAMGKTMVAGVVATILPPRDAATDSAAYVAIAAGFTATTAEGELLQPPWAQ